MKKGKITEKSKEQSAKKKYGVQARKIAVQEWLSGLLSRKAVQKKYNISSNLLSSWLRWYYQHYLSRYNKQVNVEEKSRQNSEGDIGSTKRNSLSESTISRAKAAVEIGEERAYARACKAYGLATDSKTARDYFEGYKKKSKVADWKELVWQLKRDYPQINIAELCGIFDKSRQAFYKGESKKETKEYEEALLIEHVKWLRKSLPGSGCRKLHEFMEAEGFYKRENITIGRDKLFELLSKHKLLIPSKKRRVKTTYSDHPFRKYPNIIKGKTPSQANEIWVSDITYVRMGYKIFYYLNVITDAYSRKVVGWHLSETLEAKATLLALKKAIKREKKSGHTLANLTHHSDRGVQYCSHKYINQLRAAGIKISMTEHGDPLENAIAERINRTLKEEFLDHRIFVNYEQAVEAAKWAVGNYNGLRPHASINYLTPKQAHKMKGEIPKRWKNYYQERMKKEDNSKKQDLL